MPPAEDDVERAVQAALRLQAKAFAAERDEALRSAAVERERAERAEAALRTQRRSHRRVAPVGPTTRWVEHDSGHFTCVVGSAVTAGERALLDLPWPDGWLVVGGLEVADTTKTREVDALVIAPQGLAVIEQKDVRRSGTLHFAPNGPPTLDGEQMPYLDGALTQARLPAQILASTLRDAGLSAGFIASVLAIRGNVRFAQDRVGGTHLATLGDVVGKVASIFGPQAEENLRVGTVEALVVTLGLPQAGLPPLREVGFLDSSW